MSDTDWDNEKAEQVLHGILDRLGWKPAPQRVTVTTPCLVCGRQCKAALRIHPRCYQKVGVRKAEELRAVYFKDYTPRFPKEEE